MQRLFLSILSFILLSINTYASLDTANLVHFHLKKGLPSNNAYSIIQDRNGYYWFATDHGIVKYNGYTMQVYNTENGNLPSDDIFDMWEDSQGRMWLKSFSDKLGYIKNGKFKEVHYKHGNRVVRIQNYTECDGVVYFTEEWGGKFNIVFFSDDHLRTYTYSFGQPINGDSSGLKSLTVAGDLKIHFWTNAFNVHELDCRTAKITCIGKFPEDFNRKYTYGLFIGSDNIAHRAGIDYGEVMFLDLRTMINKGVSIYDYDADPSERIITYMRHDLPGNRADNLSIVTNSHLYTFTKDYKFISREKFSDIVPTTKFVVYRMKDTKDNMWYATKGDGAWSKPFFYNFYVSRKKYPEFVNSQFVGSIKDVDFWWEKSSLTLYEAEGGKITGNIILKKGVDVRCVSGNDTVAYISASNSIYIYDRKKVRLSTIPDKYGPALVNLNPAYDSLNNTLMLHETRKNVFVGNKLFTLTGNGFVNITIRSDSALIKTLEDERFVGLFLLEKNNIIYTYSNHRLAVVNLNNNTYKFPDMGVFKKAGINSIKQLEADHYGNVFILDEKDLFLYDEQKKTIKKIDVKFSLANSIFHVKNDELYIAGKFGVAFANVKGLLDVGDFSVIPNITDGGHARVENFILNNDNTAIMQTDMEVYSFSLDSLKKYARVVNKRSDFFSLILLSPSEKKITGNDTFRYVQSEDLIKLDVINSYGKGNVQYTYRINNAAKWEQSSSGEIFIATLKPGIYNKIECVADDDVWKSNVYTFYIYRYPYWWQTKTWQTIFWITGLLLLVVLVIVTIVVTRHYSAKKEEKKRALTELELRAIHAQINPHFIFNTLSAALFFINKKRFDDAYIHVNKFSKLLRSYLKSSQNRFVILGEEIDMLRNYIELQQIRFEEKFTYTIEIDNKLPINNIQIPSLLIQPLVENAINHGLFHSMEAGELSIRFMQGAGNSELICEIEDNGVGRDAAKKINEGNSAKDSYGTKLTNKLLDIFKEYEHMDISLKYTDKPYPDTGTIVVLTLKNLKYIT